MITGGLTNQIRWSFKRIQPGIRAFRAKQTLNCFHLVKAPLHAPLG